MVEPNIDKAVDKRIDTKIDAAQLPDKDPAASVSPDTTKEQDRQSLGEREALDRKTKGQRYVNLVWEVTQAIIAVAITGSVIYCDIYQIKTENLGKAFVLIIAIYFVRMNHVKTGGVGGTDSR